MIQSEQKRLLSNSTTVVDGLQIATSANMADRPSAVEMSFGAIALQIEGFADRHVDSESGTLEPFCEVVRWKELLVIVGLPALVVAGPTGLHRCDLFRSPSDDRGFYRTEWADASGQLLCAYESGLLVLSSAGSVVWHRRKYWDDIFVGIDRSSIKLLTGDENLLVIDFATGDTKT